MNIAYCILDGEIGIVTTKNMRRFTNQKDKGYADDDDDEESGGSSIPQTKDLNTTSPNWKRLQENVVEKKKQRAPYGITELEDDVDHVPWYDPPVLNLES